MDWIGEYIIEDNGLCRWMESMKISDPDLANACRENLLLLLCLETSAQLGVKVGVA